jgi:hypothetical protein
MNYKKNSSYRNTPQTRKYLDIYQPAMIPDFTDTRIIAVTAKYHNRPDLLAYDLFDDSQLWWVLVLYNQDILLDPIRDLTTSIKLVIPNNKNSIGS